MPTGGQMWKLDEKVNMGDIFSLLYSALIGFFNEISSLSVVISNHVHHFISIFSAPTPSEWFSCESTLKFTANARIGLHSQPHVVQGIFELGVQC